mmetsp:Transcript_97150/g.173037  ORF Transcript_97150/g.173037 Transcript_97150/m.173037 type:complete len:172 (+) Transcript_97150:36-551(+)
MGRKKNSGGDGCCSCRNVITWIVLGGCAVCFAVQRHVSRQILMARSTSLPQTEVADNANDVQQASILDDADMKAQSSAYFKERYCTAVDLRTTVANGNLLGTERPVQNVMLCSQRCQARQDCNTFSWHEFYEENGLEHEWYSRRCFFFADVTPNKETHVYFSSGQCFEKEG